jgi:hypothetical protein
VKGASPKVPNDKQEFKKVDLSFLARFTLCEITANYLPAEGREIKKQNISSNEHICVG